MRLPSENIPRALRVRIAAAVRAACAAYPAGGDGVVRLAPGFDVGDEAGSNLRWDFKLTVLSHVGLRLWVVALPALLLDAVLSCRYTVGTVQSAT